MQEKDKIIRGDEIDLRVLAEIIWSGRRFIVLITAAITLIGILYSLIATPYYKSTITMYPAVRESNTGLSQFKGLATSLGYSVGSETNFNIPDIVKSRRLRKMILDQRWNAAEYQQETDLISYWGINDPSRKSLNPATWVKNLFSGGNPVGESDIGLKWEKQALERLGELISVSEEKSGLIKVSVWLEEPQLAADMANFVASAVLDYTTTVQSTQARHNREFIEERMVEVKEDLGTAEHALTDFRQRNRRISDSPELQISLERLMRDVGVQTQVFTTLRQQHELAKINEVKETPSIVILDEADKPVGKDRPKTKLIVVSSLVFGLLVSPFVFLLKNLISKKKRNN